MRGLIKKVTFPEVVEELFDVEMRPEGDLLIVEVSMPVPKSEKIATIKASASRVQIKQSRVDVISMIVEDCKQKVYTLVYGEIPEEFITYVKA